MAKKRKSQGELVIKVGDRTISLDGYLNKRAEPKDEPVVETPDAHKANETAKNEIAQAESAQVSELNKTSGNPKYLKTRRKLPLWAHQDEIRKRLRKHDVLVLVGETGSGKSTQVPQFLYQEDWCHTRRVRVTASHESDGKKRSGKRTEEVSVGGVIAITQPRRVAATTLALRVALEANPETTSGASSLSGNADARGLVGYSVRFDHRVPRGMRIKFLTEGMLLQEMLRDPHLRQYSAVIVDEIHERSVDVDLLAGFLKQIVWSDRAGRGGVPLKVVVMSATANVEGIRNFFGSSSQMGDTAVSKSLSQVSAKEVQYLRIEGRQFHVDVVHTPEPVPDILEALLKTVIKIHTREPCPGDILAFLTGQEEIEVAQRLIEEEAATLPPTLPKIKVFPLYGQLSMKAQQDAFRYIKSAETRKVVLATNIAETSVTVPGVRYVVDCGKAKVKEFRTRLGMESLLARAISKSSAIQRTGRAGREARGKCWRLYTEDAFTALRPEDLPEILRTDVLGAVLTMKARGIQDIFAFPLMDAPEAEAIERALLHLNLLGALDNSGAITTEGRRMVLFPVVAPLAKVLLRAADPQFDCVLETIDIIACITSGDDIFLQLHSRAGGAGEEAGAAQDLAEARRQELRRREGDLLTYLTTMQRYAAEPPRARAEWCRARKINLRNMRQAWNIRKQLRMLCMREKLLDRLPDETAELHSQEYDEDGDDELRTDSTTATTPAFTPTTPERATAILKCFLRGFALKSAILAPNGNYETSHLKHVVAVHPASVVHAQKREAIMFLEHIFTTKNWVKKVSAIEAVWIAEALEAEESEV